MSDDSLLINIEKQIQSYSDIISYQKEEILKTEKLVDRFNNHLFTQNEALKMFIEEQAKIVDERQKILNKRITPCTSTQLTVTIPQSLSKFKAPVRAIDRIKLVLDEAPDTYILYSSQEMIPNKLKIVEDPRHALLLKICNNSRLSINTIGSPQFPNKKIPNTQLSQPMYIHISGGNINLAWKKEEEHNWKRQPLLRLFSYFLPLHFIKGHIIYIEIQTDELDGTQTPAYMMVEVIHMTEQFPISTKLTQELHINTYKYCISQLLVDDMTIEEIRKKIIFINMKSANGINRELLPISIAAVNYLGKILIHSILSPRQFVMAFDTKMNAIGQRDVEHAQDADTTLGSFCATLKGKIVIGHDIRLEKSIFLEGKIPLLGLRDLLGNPVLAGIMGKRSWKVSEYANKIPNVGRQSKVHSALEDVLIIRDVYLAIESSWKDNTMEEIWSAPENMTDHKDLKLRAFMNKDELLTRLQKSHKEWVYNGGKPTCPSKNDKNPVCSPSKKIKGVVESIGTITHTLSNIEAPPTSSTNQ